MKIGQWFADYGLGGLPNGIRGFFTPETGSSPVHDDAFGVATLGEHFHRLAEVIVEDAVKAHRKSLSPEVGTEVGTPRTFLAPATRLTDPAMRDPVNRAAANGPGRNRTCDLGIKSPLLCQLSYRPRSERVSARPRYSWRAAPID
jgi:hypothetical protein